MLIAPSFENSILVTDDPSLAAQLSSLFQRPRHYFSILNAPRIARPDAGNEIIRCQNAMSLTGARNVLVGRIPLLASTGIKKSFPNAVVADNHEEHVQALLGKVKRPTRTFPWGRTNLGIGLYRARLAGKELSLDLSDSPEGDLVETGRHLLVACERGDELSEVIASNLAFSSGASFAVFPELPKPDREAWIEELYTLGESRDLRTDFGTIVAKASNHLKNTDFNRYKAVLFVSSGFPWGVAVPTVATTHMYSAPDFGRAVIEGMWASQTPERSARNALLVDPGAVEGSEIPAINQELLKNGTLTRLVNGAAATIHKVQSLLDLLPHDIIVLSSHAGDVQGERITYEYPDSEGRQRRLVVDQALGIGHSPFDDKFMVTSYHRFHSLDGVEWHDQAGKAALPVGSAITAWSAMEGQMERKDFIVDNHTISRVLGSMAIKLEDGNWLFVSHGFAPGAAPIFVNNSCWSWHELSARTTFAGARAYVGSLFPITDVEAQEVGKGLFGRHIGRELFRALWQTQRDTYGLSGRRPYVMIGLPFVSILPNRSDSILFTEKAFLEGIAHWSDQAKNSLHEEIRINAEQAAHFLVSDLLAFRKGLKRGRPPRK